MWAMVSLVSVCLEPVLVSVQCTVCAERTIGLEIILNAPDGTPRWRGSCGIYVSVHSEMVLVSKQDRCTVCAKRTMGLEFILDAPDGSPRCRGSSGSSCWSV
jgi:hypothetical protein